MESFDKIRDVKRFISKFNIAILLIFLADGAVNSLRAQQSASDCHGIRVSSEKECYNGQADQYSACMKLASDEYSNCIREYNRRTGGPVSPRDICNLPGMIKGKSYMLKSGGSVMCP